MPVRKAHPQKKKDPSMLTVREERVLALQRQGKTALEIAAEIGVDVWNIKKTIKVIAEKLECQAI